MLKLSYVLMIQYVLLGFTCLSLSQDAIAKRKLELTGNISNSLELDVIVHKESQVELIPFCMQWEALSGWVPLRQESVTSMKRKGQGYELSANLAPQKVNPCKMKVVGIWLRVTNKDANTNPELYFDEYRYPLHWGPRGAPMSSIKKVGCRQGQRLRCLIEGDVQQPDEIGFFDISIQSDSLADGVVKYPLDFDLYP